MNETAHGIYRYSTSVIMPSGEEVVVANTNVYHDAMVTAGLKSDEFPKCLVYVREGKYIIATFLDGWRK